MQSTQPGKVRKGSVGSHDQDDRGGGNGRQVKDATVGIHRPGNLGDNRFTFGRDGPDLGRQEGGGNKHAAQDASHPDEGGTGVLAARFFEGCNAIGDGFNTGQRGGAIGKSPQDQRKV